MPVTMHHKNLAIQKYKFSQVLSPLTLNEVFADRNCIYNLRGNKFLNRQQVNSKILGYFNNKIKDSGKINTVKSKMKKWAPRKCSYKLNKTYVPLKEFIPITKMKKYM